MPFQITSDPRSAFNAAGANDDLKYLIFPKGLQSYIGKTNDKTGDKDGVLEVGVGDNVPRYFLETLGLAKGLPRQSHCLGTQDCVV